MRQPVEREKLEALMVALGHGVTSEGCIYLTGGATALLHGWRAMTIDVDLRADPESFRIVVDQFCNEAPGR